MKSSRRTRPFSSVELSAQQSREYEALVDTITSATLAEYDAFVLVAERTINKTHWKSVRKRDDVTVYKQIRRDREHTIPASLRQPAEDQPWRLPKLLAVGTIAGTLNDLMYGIASSGAPPVPGKPSFGHDHVLDSTVLHRLKGATMEDPFQSLGLKWMVKGDTSALRAVIRPRDFVFLEATGIQTLPDGERVGYHVVHSVDVPQCEERTALSMQRARVSSCFLYRELQPGVLEVYMVAYVDPGGKLPARLAMASTVHTLLQASKVVWCAKTKKLAWLFANDDAHRRFRETGSVNLVDLSRQRCCCVCSRKLRSYNSVLGCQLCFAWICSRCAVTRRLPCASEDLSSTASQPEVDVCKACIARVAGLDAVAIARDQYVLNDVEILETKNEKPATHGMILSDMPHAWGADQNEWFHDVDPVDELIGPGDTTDKWTETLRVSQDELELETRTLASPAARATGSSLPREGSHTSLLEQMHSLCLAAEHAYQLTAMYSSQLHVKPSHFEDASAYSAVHT